MAIAERFAGAILAFEERMAAMELRTAGELAALTQAVDGAAAAAAAVAAAPVGAGGSHGSAEDYAHGGGLLGAVAGGGLAVAPSPPQLAADMASLLLSVQRIESDVALLTPPDRDDGQRITALEAQVAELDELLRQKRRL